MFDIDGIYIAQNDRIWAVDREEADKKVVSGTSGSFHKK